MVAAEPRGRIVLAQFVLLALTWGSSFLFIKVGLRGLSPNQVVAGRLFTGAGALIAISLVRRSPWPRRPMQWVHLGALGILFCVLPFSCFAWAEQHLSSGLTSIYNATTPLMTTLVALAALPAERPTRAKLTGLLVGFVGVLLVLGPWRTGIGGSLTPQLACLGATLCYGLAFVYMRRSISPSGLGALPIATVQTTLGAVVMLVLGPAYLARPMTLSWPVGLSILGLGVMGTGVAYVLNANVISAWGATNASTVTYLTPVVGVALGIVLLGETITWNEPVGGLVVVAGIIITRGTIGPGWPGWPGGRDG